MKRNMLIAMIMALLIVFGGCASAAFACERTETVAYVTAPADSAVPVETEEIVQNILEEKTLEVTNLVYTEEKETDESQSTISDRYDLADAEFFEGMTDEEILAGFVQYEGGELFEKMLVAQIVVDILNREDAPHEDLASLLCDIRYFGIQKRIWNIICAEIEDENLLIAQTVLTAAEEDKDMTEYDGYTYKFIFDMDRYPGLRSGDFEFYFETEHYVFFQR